MSSLTTHKTACLIVGMHRSGTSAVSKLLSALGADLGNTIMPAKDDNPTGFWENEKVVALNDEMLKALGSRWDYLMFNDSATYLESLLTAFSGSAKKLILEEFSNKSFISIKDPRVSFFIPFWQSVLEDLGYSVKLVLVSRNPSELALSLNRRNDLNAEFAAVLWLETITAIFKAADNLLLIDYRALLRKPEQVVEETAKYLNVDKNKYTDNIANYVETFLDKGLNHFNDSKSSVSGGELEKIYTQLIYREHAEVLDKSKITELLCELERNELAGNKIQTSYVKYILESNFEGLQPDFVEWVMLDEQESKFPLYVLWESISAAKKEKINLEQDLVQAEQKIANIDTNFSALKVEHGKKIEEKTNIEAAYAEERRSNEWLKDKYKEEQKDKEFLKEKLQEEKVAKANVEGRYQEAREFKEYLEGKHQEEKEAKECLEEKYREEKEAKEYLEGKYQEEKNAKEYLEGRLLEEQQAKEYLEGKCQEESETRDWLQEKLRESEGRINHWMAHVGEAVEATEQSARWRLGDRMVTWINRLRGKKRPNLALYRAIEVIKEYRNWNSKKESCLGEKAPAEGDQLTLGDLKDRFSAEAEEKLELFLASDNKLELKCSEAPQVSIVLIFYNRAELSYRCLQSIAEYCADLEYEVIIIDNASSDKSRDLLNKVHGAKITLNDDNVGFLLACNQALSSVEGKNTLFFNNDAELLENSMQQALSTLESDETIGAVGGRIVLLDGSLQEAGSIIWSDGSCLGYGREENPDRYPFLYQRDVDYCSGAFLLTRTALLKAQGGFDERYAPAYYEETDYCLSLWEQGYRVVYAPGVVVRHFEFASSEKSSYATDLMTKNKAKFVEKHKAQLSNHFSPDVLHILSARCSTVTTRKNILYIDDRVPHGYFGSGFPRSNFVLNSLVEMGHQVTMFPLNFPHEETLASLYSDIDKRVEIAFGIGREGFAGFWQERKSLYDIVWVSRPHNMEFIAAHLEAKPKACRVIYDAEAIFADRDTLEAQVVSGSKSGKSHAQLLNGEMLLAAKADVVIAVSDKDKRVFSEKLSSRIMVGCVGHALESRHNDSPLSKRGGLLFVGNLDEDGSPNVDSLLWFYRDIWPLIKLKLPDTFLNIVGSNRASSLQAISDPNIVFHGRVDDIDRFYEGARVFIAPTRFAAGIPYKLHEAASYGLPAVATDLLAEQLGWKIGDDILVSTIDDARIFSDNCQVLLENDKQWYAINNALEIIVAKQCDTEEINREIIAALDFV